MEDHLKLLNEVHDNKDAVLGEIYMIKNTKTGLMYIGQTLTHRMNHKRYRPFGHIKRFKGHISEALCNTKSEQCSCIANAIRKYGVESFEVSLLARCSKNELDDLETHYVSMYDTIHPNGYNLAPGGRIKHSVTTDDFERVSVTYDPTPRTTARSQETKDKISAGLQRFKETKPENMLANMQKFKDARTNKKLERFKDVVVQQPLSQYVTTTQRKNVWRSTVKVGTKEVTFESKFDTEEESRERAMNFLKQVQEMNQATVATSSN